MADDVFQCEKCENILLSWESLRKHLEDHTDNQTRTSGGSQLMKAGSFERKYCASKFRFKNNLRGKSEMLLTMMAIQSMCVISVLHRKDFESTSEVQTPNIFMSIMQSELHHKTDSRTTQEESSFNRMQYMSSSFLQ